MLRKVVRMNIIEERYIWKYVNDYGHYNVHVTYWIRFVSLYKFSILQSNVTSPYAANKWFYIERRAAKFTRNSQKRYLPTKKGRNIWQQKVAKGFRRKSPLSYKRMPLVVKRHKGKAAFKSIVKLTTDSAFDTYVHSFRMLQIYFLSIYVYSV